MAFYKRILSGPFAPPYQKQAVSTKEIYVYSVELLIVLLTTIVSFVYFYTTKTTTITIGSFQSEAVSDLAGSAFLTYSKNVTNYRGSTLTIESTVLITTTELSDFEISINELPSVDFGLGSNYISPQWS